MNEAVTVGTVTALVSVDRKTHESGDSGHRLLFVRVSRMHEDIDTEEVIKALKYTISNTSCGHEHDCCGCTRENVYGLKYLTTNFYDEEIWVLRIHWNRVN